MVIDPGEAQIGEGFRAQGLEQLFFGVSGAETAGGDLCEEGFQLRCVHAVSLTCGGPVSNINDCAK